MDLNSADEIKLNKTFFELASGEILALQQTNNDRVQKAISVLKDTVDALSGHVVNKGTPKVSVIEGMSFVDSKIDANEVKGFVSQFAKDDKQAEADATLLLNKVLQDPRYVRSLSTPAPKAA